MARGLDDVGISVAISTVNSHLRGGAMETHGLPRFTVKRLYVQEEARNSVQVKDLRREFITRFKRETSGGCIVVFVDETPFQILDCRNKGRAPVGQRAVTRRRRVKLGGITAITAISDMWGVVHVEFVIGSVSSDVFRVFLGHLFETISSKTREAVLIVMDNAPIHKTSDVIDMIHASGHRVLHAAPWSCELNPIEYVFGFVKSRLCVPLHVTTQQEALPHLVEAFRSATRGEISRSVNFVKEVLFPRAWNREDLQLRTSVGQFVGRAQDETDGESGSGNESGSEDES
jgi:transposase